ncbi:hypothetical protein ABE354_04905 [Brevibacillus laterosporus]|uniref:hypothetical protein n=1 Tax=Brevibacillus laterosporus TaxID=1465 RepID=UPI003D1B4FA8
MKVFSEIYSRNKKKVICLLVVLICFPAILNFIVFSMNTPLNNVNNDTAWLGFFASYFGSIISGLISGGLTLLGVIYTIRHSEKNLKMSLSVQEKEKYVETISNKLVKHFKVKRIIYNLSRKIGLRNIGYGRNWEKRDVKELDSKIITYLLTNLNVLLMEAAGVDYLLYKDVHDFVKSIRSYVFELDNSASIPRLEEEVEKLIKTIEMHEQRLNSNFENASK